MRRLVIIGFLALGSSALSGQAFEEYGFQQLLSLKGLEWGVNSYTAGIDHLAFAENGDVVVWDKVAARVRRISPSGQISDGTPLANEFALRAKYTLHRAGEWLAIDQFVGSYLIVRLATGEATELRFVDYGLSSYSTHFDAVLVPPVLVYQPRDDTEYHTFQITQTEQGLEYIYRDPEQTREYIDSTYSGRDEFWFDGEYLMYGERLVTANPRTFDRYFKNRPGYDDAGGITTTSDTSFLGMDNDGNYYWVNPLFLAVYTPTGRLLHAMRFNMVPEMGRPQIDPQGNIYILSYGGITPGQLDLLWIERDW